MPALRSVKTVGFIPMLPQFCLNNLTHLDLALGDPYHTYSNFLYSLSLIPGLLQTLRSIESLTLRLFDIQIFWDDGDQPATLPTLRVFRLITENSQTDALGQLLDVLSTPNLRMLSLDVQMESEASAEWLTQVFLPADIPRFENLEMLAYRMTFDDGDGDHCALDILLNRLPKLQHLTISDWRGPWPVKIGLHEYFDPSNGCPPSVLCIWSPAIS